MTMTTNNKMKADVKKVQQYFKYNYYQWATPRSIQEARQFALVKAWRKQSRNVNQNGEAI